MFKTLSMKSVPKTLCRHFSKKNKEPEIFASSISTEFKKFQVEKKKYEDMLIQEIDRQQENALANILDCYSAEIRLEMFFHVTDEPAVYLETILNYLGLLYRQNTEAEYLDRLPVYLGGFLGLDIKRDQVKLPAMRVYETFEEERWVFGSEAIIQALTERRIITIDNIKKDPWALAGADFVDREFKPVVDFIFKYPIV